MLPHIADGAECLLFGPPLSLAGEAAHRLLEHGERRSMRWLSRRITIAVNAAYLRSGESSPRCCAVMRRPSSASRLDTSVEQRSGNCGQPECTNVLNTLDERQEIPGSRRLRRSTQPIQKREWCASSALKQLVERVSLLIAYATSDRTIADALGARARLVHDEFQDTRGRQKDLLAMQLIDCHRQAARSWIHLRGRHQLRNEGAAGDLAEGLKAKGAHQLAQMLASRFIAPAISGEGAPSGPRGSAFLRSRR